MAMQQEDVGIFFCGVLVGALVASYVWIALFAP